MDLRGPVVHNAVLLERTLVQGGNKHILRAKGPNKHKMKRNFCPPWGAANFVTRPLYGMGPRTISVQYGSKSGVTP